MRARCARHPQWASIRKVPLDRQQAPDFQPELHWNFQRLPIASVQFRCARRGWRCSLRRESEPRAPTGQWCWQTERAHVHALRMQHQRRVRTTVSCSVPPPQSRPHDRRLQAQGRNDHRQRGMKAYRSTHQRQLEWNHAEHHHVCRTNQCARGLD